MPIIIMPYAYGRYATVERRAKILQGEQYTPIPSDVEFEELLVHEIGLRFPAYKFIESRDGCKKVLQKPVFQLPTPAGNLWPLIIIEQNGLLFLCLPLVDVQGVSRPPLIQIPGISVGFSLVLSLADYLGPLTHNTTETSVRLIDAYKYLCEAAPFGTPLNTSGALVHQLLDSKPCSGSPSLRSPAWRPVPYKGKPQVYIIISEQVRCAQYDKAGVDDVWAVYGTVSCKAELNGAAPEVSLGLDYHRADCATPIQDLVLHPCAHCSWNQTLTGIEDSTLLPTMVCFTPPPEMFVLCHYTANMCQLPIRGFYQMREMESSVTIMLQVKLNPSVQNYFDYCEVQMPFYNRGEITHVDSTVSVGKVVTSNDKRILVWNIGEKFPSNTLEASLSSTLKFSSMSTPSNTYEDPFCTELNAYAKVVFKVSNYTLSECWVDVKSISISPSAKAKVLTARDVSSIDYRIWNSHGNAPIADCSQS
ncbi:PREDICTED: AP-5 complex subunit mu-1-like [Priapulus caudatus]|uniref:AP-5 complex subunit mu-1 n=1 Tax=Priapulus caudatus TaxID=37621 RepID=A0ABM1DTI9_PRICU|nr:PREDICTED: AP-5 complex subunit mu-1-like [Priapulus caudatus]